VLTEIAEAEFKADPGLQEHETRHTTQSAENPLTYEADYIAGVFRSLITTGTFFCGHPMEIGAGLREGNYDQCD
jgi:hypothetical protein